MYLCHNCHHLLAFSVRSSAVPPLFLFSCTLTNSSPIATPSRHVWHYNFCLSLSLSTKASPCARASPNPVTSRRKVPMKLPRNPAQVSRSGAPSVEHSTHSHAVAVVCALRWALSSVRVRSKAPCFHRCLSESPASFHFARSPSCSVVHSARRGVHITYLTG